MPFPNERSDLGRIEPWLRAVGLAIWLFVGLSRWPLGAATAMWAGYGAAFILCSLHRVLPAAAGPAALGVQALCVLFMPRLGFHRFEGLLLSVVVAQAPTVLPWRVAAAWAVLQVGPLLASVAPYETTRVMMDIFGAYTTFSLFALLVYWLHGEERRARRALADANAKLVEARAGLVESSREAERVRISRELHDSLGHHLTALRIQLELASKLAPSANAEPVARARDISRDALGEVRRVVSALAEAPPLDVAQAVHALAAGIPAPVIHVDLPPGWRVADADLAHRLFRCIQEAVTNSVKHARAQNVWVEVKASSDALHIAVRDDGQGATSLKVGRGLAGMRARVDEVGGTIAFSNNPGRGFAVVLRVALPGATA